LAVYLVQGERQCSWRRVVGVKHLVRFLGCSTLAGASFVDAAHDQSEKCACL